MFELIKLNLMLITGLVCGPILAYLITFYTDILHLTSKFKVLRALNYDWKLVIIFGLFWMGIYFCLTFWSAFRRFINRPPKLEWWQTETVYQIYVKSFYDSNGDGVGDLRGIIEKLDYIESLGTKTIWLNPIYPSGGKDGGYDITSFVDIDPVYGTMHDFEELVEQVHKRGMHILMDFIPNHTSNLHKWFVESCKDEPNNPYRDYYVWYPSDDKVNPPNNWKSVFGGSAWTYVESRKAWYLHQFLAEQPDLNLRSSAVKTELEKVISFWLKTKKIDGISVNSAKYLFVNDTFENEPLLNTTKFTSVHDPNITYDDLKHTYTINQPKSFQIVHEWQSIVETLAEETKSSKVLIIDSANDLKSIQNFGSLNRKSSTGLVSNHQLCNITHFLDKNKINSSDAEVRFFKPKYVKNLINDYKKNLPDKSWTYWQLGSSEFSRISSRIGAENVNLANVINLLLGGTAVVYYGEEIGMQDLPKECLKFEECQDDRAKSKGPSHYLDFTRDLERTPMQWNDQKNAGFSSSERLWLPANPNHKDINVNQQTDDKKSVLGVFRELVSLRQQVAFQWGLLKMVTVNDQVFSFLRKAIGFDVYLIAMNMSDTTATANLLVNSDIAPRAYVTLYIPGNCKASKSNDSNSKDEVDLEVKYKPKAAILTKNVLLKPHDCLILSWPTSD